MLDKKKGYSTCSTTPSSVHTQTKKISLKLFKSHNFQSENQRQSQLHKSTYKGSQQTQTTLNSHKKSLKSLLQNVRTSQHSIVYYFNTEYEDIRCPELKQNKGLLQNLFCNNKKIVEKQGCKCEPKCFWFDYWYNISQKTHISFSNYEINQKISIQIQKDLTRTQPQQPQFQRAHYQQALYQILVSYAKSDPEIQYIQGLNVISSIILFHCNTQIDQCCQIFKQIMITCNFRQLFLNNFTFAYQISTNIKEYLKHRCHDLYTHMIVKNQVNLDQFIVGWLIPMFGNIIPIQHMHLVVNTFIQRSWIGLMKIAVTMLLYFKKQILNIHDQTQIMLMLSTNKLRSSKIDWLQIIRSSNNLKYLSIK